ncbi:MAG: pilus assembly protein [Gluconacetobacter diazotrophicus]|nr:pilus assembly protein [Gluconacetobacter diazotrophicus]
MSARCLPLAPSGGLFRDRRGVAAVEFALIAPLLFMLVLGILGWGQFLLAETAVSAAAQEAARASVGGLSTAERISLATAAARSVMASYSTFLDASKITVTTSPASATASSSPLFGVTVTYTMASSAITSLVPLPTAYPTCTITVAISTGGY